MKQNLIVTGGLGFIGSNLIKLLIEKNYSVINIDSISTNHWSYEPEYIAYWIYRPSYKNN